MCRPCAQLGLSPRHHGGGGGFPGVVLRGGAACKRGRRYYTAGRRRRCASSLFFLRGGVSGVGPGKITVVVAGDRNRQPWPVRVLYSCSTQPLIRAAMGEDRGCLGDMCAPGAWRNGGTVRKASKARSRGGGARSLSATTLGAVGVAAGIAARRWRRGAVHEWERRDGRRHGYGRGQPAPRGGRRDGGWGSRARAAGSRRDCTVRWRRR